MHDDIRPPRHAQPSATPKLPTNTTALSASTTLSNAFSSVDEAKLTAEFGPTPETAAANVITEPATPSQTVTAIPAADSLLLADEESRISSDKSAPQSGPIAKTKNKTKHPGKRKLLLLIAAVVLVVLAGGASYAIMHWYTPAHKSIAAVPHKPKPVVPTTIASTLTGLVGDLSINDRPVTAVMIENSVDARPQSGLDQAGVVFEAIAEGGVTRFMALFQDTTSDYIGPVRSARPYYIQWLLGFDAAYAHVGGSPDALSDITSWNVKDLNQFYNAGAYQRISSRYAPHNVYTSTDQLAALESQKGFGKSTYTGFTHKKEVPSKTPTATNIDIKFSGYYYDSHYDYDATTNTYKRSESGAPHMELHKDGSQVQIAPKVVVAMVVPEQNGELDSSGAYYADYASIGSGQIQVFQDGVVTVGTWSKDSNTAPLVFKDANGQLLALNAGQVWIAATPLATNVIYK